MIRSIKNLRSFRKGIKSNSKVMVKFYAPWCIPCKMSAGVYKALAKRNPDIDFYQVNIDDAPELAKKYKAKKIPTFQIYKDGKIKRSVQGYNLPDLLKLVENIKEQ